MKLAEVAFGLHLFIGYFYTHLFFKLDFEEACLRETDTIVKLAIIWAVVAQVLEFVWFQLPTPTIIRWLTTIVLRKP